MFLPILFLCFASASVANALEDRGVDPAADPTRASVLSVLATVAPSSALAAPTLAPGDKPPAWYEKLPIDAKSLLPSLYPKKEGDVRAAGTIQSSSEGCSSTTTITMTLTKTAGAPEESTECTTTTSTTTSTLTVTVQPSSTVILSSSQALATSGPASSSVQSEPTPVFSVKPTLPPYANLTATARPTSAGTGTQAPSGTSSPAPTFTGGVGRVVADFMVMGVLGAGGIWLGLA
ncbi:hypothetical protein DM02DRAFT_648152 [Periconia macrospinosa]|uniref:Uncharacterized protein n=1 Tax=Periconia macrospinosa TaxID=97972 RepID=A0A2V1EDI9_9PLEO|nr:hypothetical protein DM02DRAFT_648152 [Periconia macrospinosa]